MTGDQAENRPVIGLALCIDTPVGPLTILEEDGAIASVHFAGLPPEPDKSPETGREPEQGPTPLLAEAKSQLGAYFAKRLTVFDLPLTPAPTSFQGQVRTAMLAIPVGRTRSYGEIAADLSSAARAVGQACGRNPIPVIVPCHRVLGAGGSIGGYSGGSGLPTKRLLLALEGGPFEAGLSKATARDAGIC